MSTEMRPVQIAGLALEASTGAPMVVLREDDEPHRIVPIFVGGSEAAAIGLALTGQASPRPLTYDLMASLMASLDAQVERVEVTEVRDGAFVAELALTGPRGDCRLDTRPSDAIALALRVRAPLYVSDAVLEVAGTVAEPTSPDERAIEEEVAAFRTELDALGPDDFAAGPDPEPEGDTGPGESTA